MDLSVLKSKLDSLNNAGKKKQFTQGEKIDYSKYYFKPTVGKHQIRIVPSKFNPQNPFKEVFFHYGLIKAPLLALNNFGESDPILEFTSKLYQTGDKDNKELAKKLSPKMRVFVPVIVRGEEEKGVRLWEFGATIYKSLLGIADDDDYGDFTDITEGHDFTITGTASDFNGRPTVECSINVKPKKTPLSTDPELVTKWLDEQPDVLGLQIKKSYDELTTLLKKWLNPEDKSESKPETATPEVDSKKSLKVDTSDSFDELFKTSK